MSRSHRFLIEFLAWHLFAFFVIGIVGIGLKWLLNLDDLATPIGVGFSMGWIGSVGFIAHIGDLWWPIRWGVLLALFLLGSFIMFFPVPDVGNGIVVAFFLAVFLIGIRRFWWRSELKIPTDPPPSFTPRKMQFTIRQLLILTTMVGCLLGIGRLVWPWMPSFQFSSVFVPLFLIVTVLPCAFFGWLAVWASGIAEYQQFPHRFLPALALLSVSTIAQNRLFGPTDTLDFFWFWWVPTNLSFFLSLYFSLQSLRCVDFRLITARSVPSD